MENKKKRSKCQSRGEKILSLLPNKSSPPKKRKIWQIRKDSTPTKITVTRIPLPDSQSVDVSNILEKGHTMDEDDGQTTDGGQTMKKDVQISTIADDPEKIHDNACDSIPHEQLHPKMVNEKLHPEEIHDKNACDSIPHEKLHLEEIHDNNACDSNPHEKLHPEEIHDNNACDSIPHEKLHPEEIHDNNAHDSIPHKKVHPEMVNENLHPEKIHDNNACDSSPHEKLITEMTNVQNMEYSEREENNISKETDCLKLIPVQHKSENISKIHLATTYDSDPPSPFDDSEEDPDYVPEVKKPKLIFNSYVGVDSCDSNYQDTNELNCITVTADVHDPHVKYSLKNCEKVLKQAEKPNSPPHESDIEIVAMEITCETTTPSTLSCSPKDNDTTKRAKKKVADPKKWKKNISKALRNQGKEYVSASTKKVVKARKMGPGCKNKITLNREKKNSKATEEKNKNGEDGNQTTKRKDREDENNETEKNHDGEDGNNETEKNHDGEDGNNETEKNHDGEDGNNETEKNNEREDGNNETEKNHDGEDGNNETEKNHDGEDGNNETEKNHDGEDGNNETEKNHDGEDGNNETKKNHDGEDGNNETEKNNEREDGNNETEKNNDGEDQINETEKINDREDENNETEKNTDGEDEKRKTKESDIECVFKCYEKFTDDERRAIFADFWTIADLQAQRVYILHHITNVVPKYKYLRADGKESRRANSAYYFDKNKERIRVCKKFFVDTLGISNKMIQTILRKQTLEDDYAKTHDLRGKSTPGNVTPTEVIEMIKHHIDSIPRIESHYCRAQTQKEYIDGGKTLSSIYNDYLKEMKDHNQPFAKLNVYQHIFETEYNISFFSPKKDQCEFCVKYENIKQAIDFDENDPEFGILKVKYDEHINEKNLARQEKDKDKDAALKGRHILAVFDLQAVLTCPRADVSTLYYKSKLNNYNLTVYNIATSQAECFFWNEIEGNRGVEEIGSCILKYLELIDNDANVPTDVIFYSDNCAGQQKNRFMICLYYYALYKLKNIKSITHKFLITGHTQNEGDSVHSVIERGIARCLKSGGIYTPDQYVQIIRNARKTGSPYKVIELIHEDFLSIKTLENCLDPKAIKKVKLSDIKVIKILKNKNCLSYKLSYTEEFKELKCFKLIQKNFKLKPIYKEPIPLKDHKHKDLSELLAKKIIPPFYKNYYEKILSIKK